MLNGVTQLVLTKADVMNNFEEIKICTSYKTAENNSTILPFDLLDENATPHYETLKGWQMDLNNCKKKNELPDTFKNYLAFITTNTNVPFSFISTGPERNELIVD